MTSFARHFVRCTRPGPHPRGALRTVVAALILAYVALAGETIHCQYFAPTHGEHGGHSSSKPTTSPDHAKHCLIASHGSSATAVTQSADAAPEFVQTTRVVIDDLPSAISHLVRLTPTRAPPVV